MTAFGIPAIIPPTAKSPRPPWLRWNARSGLLFVAAISLFLTFILALLISFAMNKKLDHDEHQFIASAALTARKGLLPYRDYVYFHTPYQVFIYAWLFKRFGRLLMTARLFCTACSFATICILFFVALRLFRRAGRWVALFIAAAAVALLILNPLFLATSCRSWNHDLPTLLMLLAMLFVRAATRPRIATPGLGSFTAALLMGVAIGTRLSFTAPALAFLAVAVVPLHLNRRARWILAATYLLGLLIALIPLAILAAMAPAQFYFGNVTYPVLNTAARFASGYNKSMTPLGKLAFVAVDVVLVQPPTLALVLLLIATLILRRRFRAHIDLHRLRDERVFAAIVGMAVLCGAISPTPLFLMYFFTPLVLLLLWLLLCAAPLLDHPAAARQWVTLLAIALGASLIASARQYKVGRLAHPTQWLTLRIHRDGQNLRHCAGNRAVVVLTFSPIAPLEGREDIFPQFATGPFEYRVCEFVSEADERRLGLIDADDVLKLFKSRPRAIVLTGEEHRMDCYLLQPLKPVDLTPRPLAGGLTLWSAQRVSATKP